MLLSHIKPVLNPVFINIFNAPVRNFTPRRACMYVPGDDQKKIKKALSIDVDCIILDCEDGVALTKKEQARNNIRELIDKGKPPKKRKYDLGIRVNSVYSGMVKDDLTKILSGKNLPNTIFLPKVERDDDLILFSEHLQTCIKGNKKVGLVMMVESALSLTNLIENCKRAREMSQTSKFTPVGLLFGSDDYCASIGAKRSESSFEVIYARQKLVCVAKAFNLQAIDMVHINYQDMEGLKKQAEEGMRMGFSGKQIIHPQQVDIVQDAFMPSQQDIDWASNVLEAFHKHQKEGKGAFVYKDQMIDMPTMKQAQNIMDLVNALMMRT